MNIHYACIAPFEVETMCFILYIVIIQNVNVPEGPWLMNKYINIFRYVYSHQIIMKYKQAPRFIFENWKERETMRHRKPMFFVRVHSGQKNLGL